MTTIQCIELRSEDYALNQHKFYRAYICTSGNWGITHWGRVATTGQMQKLTVQRARKKVADKSREGYGTAIQWTNVDIPDTLAMSLRASTALSTTEKAALAKAFNNRIGAMRSVAPVGATAPGKSPEEEEEEFKKQLLAMAGKLKAEEFPPAVPAPTSTPVVPAADPDSMDAKLAVALAAAKNGKQSSRLEDSAPNPLAAALAKAKSR
jgi:predicted DNA-binding WGR domain protein